MIESWAVKKILQAFENKDVGCIQSLVVQQCIHPNELIPGKGVTLLHLIIGHQSESFAFKITKLFLRCGGDPNVQSSDGVTPIHVAAAWGRNRILHLLLVNGGDPWMQDDDKKNAFNYAFEEREWNTIEMLHHFQQMHSAAKWRHDVDPKYDRSLERVLVRKGEDVFAFAPTRKSTKSMTTQTQSDCSSSSPVQEKIRYFEPVSLEDSACQKNWHMGWVKDFYQTSCEVVVHEDASAKPEDKKETFVSSVHIETSPPAQMTVPVPVPVPVPEKSEPSSMDVRGQLFVELQEAVRRRSRLKMAQQATDHSEDDPMSDSFVAKEVSYLYGINLQESGMLKNMSDFATKVMKEIEVTEGDRASEKTVDLCGSSTDFTGPYLSCEETGTAPRKTDTLPDNSNTYLTPYNSDVIRGGPDENSNESFVSLAEEYKYTDAEEGVVLLEKKLVVTPTISFLEEERVEGEPRGEGDASTASSAASSSTAPCSLSYNSDVLRSELNGLGYNPGPVTKTTKKLYLRKLWKLKKDAKRTPCEPPKETIPLVHSPALDRTIEDDALFRDIPSYAHLEEEMRRSFEKWTKRKWREGNHKTSFNYLLLDPRVSLNLPKRAPGMSGHDVWKDFLSAIFYVGKGKRCRPYAHLYQAAAIWERRTSAPPDGKTKRIIDIWRGGSGVVCLQVFQNIIPVEALTREAAMMEALGGWGLKNAKGGEYYGVAATWPRRDKASLGVYLLHKAMLIFLNEGERQIKPYDID